MAAHLALEWCVVGGLTQLTESRKFGGETGLGLPD
jgi:hypothetical protein